MLRNFDNTIHYVDRTDYISTDMINMIKRTSAAILLRSF